METQEIIKQEKGFYDSSVDLNPYFCSREADRLRLIDLYSMSLFRDANKDSLGFQKVFFNIVNFPTDTSAKMLDVDTKDFRLLPEGENYWAVWLKEKELNFWMKDKYFGRALNDYVRNWVKYGDLFLKKVGDEVRQVPLQNLIFRPTAKNLNTPIIEYHEYQKDEFEMEGKKRKWENVTEVLQGKAPIKVYEITLPQNYPGSEYNYFVVSGKHTLAFDKRDEVYKHLPFEKVPGRLLGRGIPEKLFEEQIYLNRIANYKADGLHWSSLHLFQTRDTRIASNLLTEAENGDILTVNSELQPVVNEERNLAAYQTEEQRYQLNARQKTFTREPISGGQTKTGITLGATRIQTAMASGYFDQKKEELASFLKEVMWDWVLPEFENDTKKGHTVLMDNLLDSEDVSSQKFFRAVLDSETRKRRAEIQAKGRHLTPEQIEIIKRIKSQQLRTKELRIPDNSYTNLKHKMKIVITGEALDSGSEAATLQTIFQIVGSNPTVLDDPRVRRIFNKMVSLAGINPKDIGLEEEMEGMAQLAAQQRAQRGGSIAAPRPQPQRTIEQEVTV